MTSLTDLDLSETSTVCNLSMSTINTIHCSYIYAIGRIVGIVYVCASCGLLGHLGFRLTIMFMIISCDLLQNEPRNDSLDNSFEDTSSSAALSGKIDLKTFFLAHSPLQG